MLNELQYFHILRLAFFLMKDTFVEKYTMDGVVTRDKEKIDGNMVTLLL